MTENNDQKEKQFAIQRVFIKDLSFESPNSPIIFNEKWEPAVELNLFSKTRDLNDNLFEVAITTTLTVNLGEKTAYLAEVCQGGIFLLKGFSQQEMGPMLGSFCPNVLFPYAREAVSDLVIKGGFPPMLLAPVNFDALYAHHIQDRQNPQAPGSQSLN